MLWFFMTFCAISFSSTPLYKQFHERDLSPCLSEDLNQIVGSIQGKCCQPGRRWGCAPSNFSQSGCTPIQGAGTRCISREWTTMRCTSARCITTNPEHECEVDIRRVPQNRCRPTGNRTTVGCPEEEWQCEVLRQDYSDKDSPKIEVLVCDFEVATPCATQYNHCD